MRFSDPTVRPEGRGRTFLLETVRYNGLLVTRATAIQLASDGAEDWRAPIAAALLPTEEAGPETPLFTLHDAYENLARHAHPTRVIDLDGGPAPDEPTRDSIVT